MTEVRQLSPEEVPVEAQVPEGALVIGVVEDGKVVGLVGAFSVVFLDPFWIAPDHRTKVSRTTLRELWERMRMRLIHQGITAAIGHADKDQPAMASLIEYLGGEEVVGKRQFIMKLGE